MKNKNTPKYYRSFVTVEILGEEPIENIELRDLYAYVTTGEGELKKFSVKSKAISPELMYRLVWEDATPVYFNFEKS